MISAAATTRALPVSDTALVLALPPRELTAGLDLLSTAIVLLDSDVQRIFYLNPAAENLFGISRKLCAEGGLNFTQRITDIPALRVAIEESVRNNWSYTAYDVVLAPRLGDQVTLDCAVSPVFVEKKHLLLLEFHPIDRQLQARREEQTALQQQATRELVRNLAHEIKNPLGGIRGAAQLLAHELAVQPASELREYTEVIIQEADRLQRLLQRLLSSHQRMHPAPANIHDLLEQVRLLISAEFPEISLHRDFDVSLPAITADREQLIQAFLNVVRNAAQTLRASKNPEGTIRLRTRALRQITLSKRRYPLALEVLVQDNGPGIPPALIDKIFLPLVSGRADGNGLGLTLTQGIILQHHGDIAVRSQPGETIFCIRLPLSAAQEKSHG